jgi:hypothetical protein
MEANQIVDHATIKKVFTAVDKDKSGYIDMLEIAGAAKELGITVTQEEVKSLFTEIDSNHDGKVSFEEFYAWWSIGKTKDSPKINAMKLKALNLVKNFKTKVQKVDFAKEFEAGFQNHSITVRAGGDFANQTKVGLNVFYNGEAMTSTWNEFSKGLGLETEEVALVFKFHSDNAEAAKEALKEQIDGAIEMAKALIPGAEEIASTISFKYHTEGDKILLGISSDFPLIADALDGIMMISSRFIPETASVQASFELGFKEDLLSIFQKSQANPATDFVQLLLASFVIGLKLKFSNSIVQQFRQMLWEYYSEGEYKHFPHQARQMLLGMLLQNSKAEFNFSSVDSATFAASAPPLPKFKDILEIPKQMGAKDMISGIPPVANAVELIKTHLKANIGIAVKIPKGLVTVELQTKGIKEIFDYIYT